MRSHFARDYGTGTLKALLPGRAFPFPKSLYVVEDTLRVAVGDNPDALVVDFFGGSGTTGHAVMRLNRQDGGRRRAIVVTNNEVSEAESKTLGEAGHQRGDPEWETLGIFEHVTRPRLEAAATGKTPEGKDVEGSYKFTDEFPMADGFEENVEFFELTYEDADRVRLGAAFTAVAPLLWLMAGAVGPRVDAVADGWALPDGGRYGVLFEADAWPGFAEAVKGAEGVTHAFVVTDSDAVFQRVVAELPDTVTPVRLYESYLRSFAINTGAGE
jgi:adenine-specific DNA-methyltransferase